MRRSDDPEIFRAVFETAATGMALATPEGRFLRVNAALCRIAARSEDELVATTLAEITHPDDRPLDERELVQDPQRRLGRARGAALAAAGRLDRVGRGAGGARCARSSDGPAYLLWQVADVTERRQMEQRLRHLADHDALTGLFNRRRFEEELERHVSHARRYGMEGAMLLIDVDEPQGDQRQRRPPGRRRAS